MNMDISIVVPAHNEGCLAYPTIQSLFRAIWFAEQVGLKCEIIVVLDSPNESTTSFFSRFSKDIRLVNGEFADPGLSRNYGVQMATGNFVFFLDADDLFGQKWLLKAHQYLYTCQEESIAHTEYCVVFDNYNSFWHKKSSTDPGFKIEELMENNCWDVGCGARRDLLLKYPYQPTGRNSGFGFEDWHLYCETLADRIEHHVVPETVYFARRKRNGSQLAASIAAHHLLRPTKLFDRNNFKRFF